MQDPGPSSNSMKRTIAWYRAPAQNSEGVYTHPHLKTSCRTEVRGCVLKFLDCGPLREGMKFIGSLTHSHCSPFHLEFDYIGLTDTGGKKKKDIMCALTVFSFLVQVFMDKFRLFTQYADVR